METKPRIRTAALVQGTLKNSTPSSSPSLSDTIDSEGTCPFISHPIKISFEEVTLQGDAVS